MVAATWTITGACAACGAERNSAIRSQQRQHDGPGNRERNQHERDGGVETHRAQAARRPPVGQRATDRAEQPASA